MLLVGIDIESGATVYRPLMQPVFAVFSTGSPRTANATVRAENASDAGGHWVIDAGGAVWVEFQVDAAVDEVTLKIHALAAKLGPRPGHAPLDVRVNGRIVVSRFRIPGGGDLPQELTFAVPGEWLLPGPNVLELRSATDSISTLWLYRVLAESVWDRGGAALALEAGEPVGSAFEFVTFLRAADASGWRAGPMLRFQVEGNSGGLAALAWRGADGAETAVSFAGDMSTFLGHTRTTYGERAQLRGSKMNRHHHGVGPVRRFRTECDWGDGWHQAKELSVFLEMDAEPAEWIYWRDQRGSSTSIGLARDGASFIGYAQREGEGPVGFRGWHVDVHSGQEPLIASAAVALEMPFVGDGGFSFVTASEATETQVLREAPEPAEAPAPLVRTYFADQQAWENLVHTLETPPDGDWGALVADLTVLDDRSYDGMSVERLRELFAGSGHTYFYVADEITHTTEEQHVLFVELGEDQTEARCVAADLAEIDCNVSLGNMFISDFLDDDGVCRGSM
jgi:hypothetical protein